MAASLPGSADAASLLWLSGYDHLMLLQLHNKSLPHLLVGGFYCEEDSDETVLFPMASLVPGVMKMFSDSTYKMPGLNLVLSSRSSGPLPAVDFT